MSIKILFVIRVLVARLGGLDVGKLGELIDYTGEACPNYGRVRVELWTCGKRICEKCHWCIEDEAYEYDDEDDDYSTFGE